MKSLSIKRLIKLFHISRNSFWRRAVIKGCAAAIEHRAVVERASFATVLDIGANVGQFSALIRQIAPHARIHAFEPLSGAASTYLDVFGADDLTTLHQCGLGDETGSLDIHVSQSADSSSLLEISERQSEVFPGTEEVGKETISIDKLSNRIDIRSLPGPIFVKIDVQGYELEVLKGCEGELQFVDTIYVECSFQELYIGQAMVTDVIQYLSKHDFRLRGVFNVAHDSSGECVQSDMLFSRSAAGGFSPGEEKPD